MGAACGEQYIRLYQPGMQGNAGAFQLRARCERPGNDVRFRRRDVAGGERGTGCDGGRSGGMEFALTSKN